MVEVSAEQQKGEEYKLDEQALKEVEVRVFLRNGYEQKAMCIRAAMSYIGDGKSICPCCENNIVTKDKLRKVLAELEQKAEILTKEIIE